ncbi:MAG: hypothetical protein QM775_16070 [Pirellulales bacterium]
MSAHPQTENNQSFKLFVKALLQRGLDFIEMQVREPARLRFFRLSGKHPAQHGHGFDQSRASRSLLCFAIGQHFDNRGFGRRHCHRSRRRNARFRGSPTCRQRGRQQVAKCSPPKVLKSVHRQGFTGEILR